MLKISSVFLVTLLGIASSVLGAEPSSTPTMKAIRVSAFGGPEVLNYEDVPKPTPGEGEALVHIYSAGVNPVDWKIRKGLLKGMTPNPPFIPGYDVAGMIESFGNHDGSTKLKLGDEVFAYLAITGGGGYAEYVCVPIKNLAKKPRKASWAQAGATPLAGLTAWQALFDQGGLKPGQTVLIHGAAGGVGHFAVQFAKAKGATVIATASPGNHDFLKKLGADILIDYNTQKFEDVVKEKTGGAGVDVVLDTIGGETQDRSIPIIKKGGTLVSIVKPPNMQKCTAAGITGKVFLVMPNAAELTEIASLIDDGKVTVHVSEELALDQAARAQELSETGKTRGKIVLKVK